MQGQGHGRGNFVRENKKMVEHRQIMGVIVKLGWANNFCLSVSEMAKTDGPEIESYLTWKISLSIKRVTLNDRYVLPNIIISSSLNFNTIFRR